jgi:4-hydroxy-3-polyprenylbenzoate decarboxylase
MIRRAVLAITGASGAIYGVRMLRLMEQRFDVVYLCISKHGREVLASEIGVRDHAPDVLVRELLGRFSDRVEVLDPDDFFTPPASGSVHHQGMVIAPCSMGTAGRIAAGVSNDLITRAADVCLKERRPLVLVVRETPLGLVHLRTLTALTEAGATVMPACPAFYHHPMTIDDLVDGIVERAARHLGVDTEEREWQVEPE